MTIGWRIIGQAAKNTYNIYLYTNLRLVYLENLIILSHLPPIIVFLLHHIVCANCYFC
jgi:hypothetical protein